MQRALFNFLQVNWLSRSLLTSLLGLCLLGSAQAALFGDDEARKAITELRQKFELQKQDFETRLTQQQQRQAAEVEKLKAENKEAAEQNRRSLLDLGNQLEVMRAEMAKIRGQEELNTRNLVEVQRRMKDLSQAFNDRLGRLEPGRVSVDGREFVVEPDERRDYEAALALFRGGEFDPSEAAFLSVIKRFPKTGYAPLIYFWMGNAQYATGEYKAALQNFKNLLSLDPEHLRVPEAMLSIANCLLELKDSKGAKKALEDLVKRFPKSEAAAAAKERLARMR
jgi:tol-pal system protein YbgF